MHPFAKDIETGKALMRSRGMNFTTFKAELTPLMDGIEHFSEDDWVYYYNEYAEWLANYPNETLLGFAQIEFHLFRLEEGGHDFALKKQYQLED